MHILRLFSRFREIGFLFVGGFVFALQFGGNVFCVEALGWNKQIAYFVVGLLAVEINFFLNKYINWRDRPGTFWNQYKKFHYLRLTTFAINQVMFAYHLDDSDGGYLKLNAILSAVELVAHYAWSEFIAFSKKIRHA